MFRTALLSIVRSFSLYTQQWYTGSAKKCIHTLTKENSMLNVSTTFSYVMQFAASKVSANLYDIYHFCVYSEKLLMMDRGDVRNM